MHVAGCKSDCREVCVCLKHAAVHLHYSAKQVLRAPWLPERLSWQLAAGVQWLQLLGWESCRA